MAKSKYEYVKKFETDDSCLPNCWIVVRVDGKCFHRFSELHRFEKPNDERALSLMSCAARCVMEELSDVILAYGQSDEYSFVFRRKTDVYKRRSSKLVSTVVSTFTSAYVFHWARSLPDTDLLYPPTFDGRVVLYPGVDNLRDYLSWRQVDCHINNLYNTAYWSLVNVEHVTPGEAERLLRVTNSAGKHDMLFTRFGVNYNNISDVYRKGTVLVREPVTTCEGGVESKSKGHHIATYHTDIIKDHFWLERPYLLAS